MWSVEEFGSLSLPKWSIWQAAHHSEYHMPGYVMRAWIRCYRALSLSLLLQGKNKHQHVHLDSDVVFLFITSAPSSHRNYDLMKLLQHLASSCLFVSEQMEGHLVQVKQIGSSWERCLHYHLQIKTQSCLSPSYQLSLCDDIGPDIGICVNAAAITSCFLQYPVSHTAMLWTCLTISDIPFCKVAFSDPQKQIYSNSL